MKSAFIGDKTMLGYQYQNPISASKLKMGVMSLIGVQIGDP